MTNPFADPYIALSKVYKEGAYLKQALSSFAMEEANKARTVKICYGVMEKDAYLGGIISANVKKQPKPAIKIILKIALYMIEFMGKPRYMVVDRAVEITKKAGKEGAAGFVNAFLRSYKIPSPPCGGNERTAWECSAPLWLVEKLIQSYGGEAVNILKAESRGVCVRFVRNAEKYLGRPHENTPFGGVYIFKNFVRDDGFSAGDYTFQSIGSVAICNAIPGGDSLLDACAAPGGKSVLLSEKFGSVVAEELHPHRTELIKAYAGRMGAGNVTAVCKDGTVFDPLWEGKFGAVLVDAPCSGTGVINENPDIKFFRKESDIKELCGTQLKILNNCARYVKKGGGLFYSTCSVLPEENDGVVKAFMAENGGYVLNIPDSPLPHVKTETGLQFLPHISSGAGFFLTGFIKS